MLSFSKIRDIFDFYGNKERHFRRRKMLRGLPSLLHAVLLRPPFSSCVCVWGVGMCGLFTGINGPPFQAQGVVWLLIDGAALQARYEVPYV